MGNRQERVLKYMRDFGSITSMEAFQELGVTRLSAVIFILKEKGHKITSEPMKSVNRYGEKVTFARYKLEDEKKG